MINNNMTPCVVDDKRICTPSNCCLKKVRLVPLLQEEYQTIPKLFVIHDTGSWNVVHWNRLKPNKSFTISCKNEAEARKHFNTLTKMDSTWAAMLRNGTKQEAGYVWML